jgi:hypothetical protein
MQLKKLIKNLHFDFFIDNAFFTESANNVLCTPKNKLKVIKYYQFATTTLSWNQVNAINNFLFCDSSNVTVLKLKGKNGWDFDG